MILKKLLQGTIAAVLSLLIPPVHAAIVVDESTLSSLSYIIPSDGEIIITITGADGGAGSNTLGGKGATVEGVFNVTAGQLIRYIVGGAGISNAGSSAGGGGSTGVYIDTTLAMVAGAGGGGDNSNGAIGLGGNTIIDGDPGTGSNPGIAGVGGNGGGANGINRAAGGGGVNASGGDAAAAGGGGQAVTAPALPGLLTIAQGGSGDSSGSAGGDGFTGGGGAGAFYSGGAGGYSGGGAAGANGSAGGGGSYVNTTMTSYVGSNISAGADGGGGAVGLESDGSILVDFRTPGVNPLPPADSNPAGPICGLSGDNGTANIAGVVNTYYPATVSVVAGGNNITLGTAVGGAAINANDLLMIIQMQDTVFDFTNTTSYGDADTTNDPAGSINIRQTGLYEFALAESFDGTTLVLQENLANSYHAGTNQRFQVIRVPRYTDASLSGNITASPWNGHTGGVVSLNVAGNLNLNGNSVDVSGQGFRGGVYDGDDANARLLDYVIDNSAGTAITKFYSEKGEGIAGTPNFLVGGLSLGGDGYPGGDLARGAPGNAGGGGQTHNSGGGGGGNIGAGGNGGDSWPNVANGGYGGGLFDGYSGRLLLGGGGGAGNQNNENAGVGGTGGGLVFVHAGSITPAGGSLLSNGGDGGDSSANDGAGGAGAGGTILIETASASLAGLTLTANGGIGGSVNYTDPHGPGGGGGGGAIYVDPTDASMSVFAGAPGTHLLGSEGAHGAQPGLPGHRKPLATSSALIQACDFGDAGQSYGRVWHPVPFISGNVATTSIPWLGDAGNQADLEDTQLFSAGSSSDDGDGNDDENGVSFRSPAGTGKTIFADIVVNTVAPATVCAWLDTPSTGDPATLTGPFSAADGICQAVPANVSAQTISFQWSGLPKDKQYTTTARFRISTQALTTANFAGAAADGEVEDYLLVFDFSPTAVTIGQIILEPKPVSNFLIELGVENMDEAELLNLLSAWAPQSAASLSGANRATLLAALNDYLDPDGDAQVAVLFWDTLEERGTIGFNVERKQAHLGWKRINKKMLPGLITAPMGGEYQLADPSALPDQPYQYQLIEQEARGSTRIYGPYELEMTH